MAYNLTNENPEETPGLTKGDLAVASFALAETFNSYLVSYEEEDYGELTKEEMETSMHRLRVAFIKIDSMLRAMNLQFTRQKWLLQIAWESLTLVIVEKL